MSSTCVWREVSFENRCARSPTPVRLGAKTRQWLAVRISCTARQHQPPCHAPCTSTKVRGSLTDELTVIVFSRWARYNRCHTKSARAAHGHHPCSPPQQSQHRATEENRCRKQKVYILPICEQLMLPD